MKYVAQASQMREMVQTQSTRDRLGTASLLFPTSRLLDVDQRRGNVAVDALRLADEGLTLGRVISSGHEVALEDPDNITLLLPTEGRIEMQTGDSEHGIGSGSLMMVLAEERRTRVISPNGGMFRATTLLIPRSRFLALDAEVPAVSRRPASRAAWSLDTAFGREFGRMLPELADDVFRKPDRLLTARALEEFVSLIDDLLVDAIGTANTGMRTYGGLREFQRVSRACDIIHARAEEAVSMSALATELGVSPRILQLSFREVHGMSPRQYLQRVRLDRVRYSILSQSEGRSVTSAALDCGFTHLGRFSQFYRRAYGELPSETAARKLRQQTPDPKALTP